MRCPNTSPRDTEKCIIERTSQKYFHHNPPFLHKHPKIYILALKVSLSHRNKYKKACISPAWKFQVRETSAINQPILLFTSGNKRTKESLLSLENTNEGKSSEWCNPARPSQKNSL